MRKGRGKSKKHLQRLPKVLLGSRSWGRRNTLAQMNLSFCVRTVDVDEQSVGDRQNDRPAELVTKIARLKCQLLYASLTELERTAWDILMTGDQVVTIGNKVYEKPRNASEAFDMLRAYGTAELATVGSLVLLDLASTTCVSGVEVTRIEIDPLPESVIESIVKDGLCLESAGALRIEDERLKPYIKNVQGSISAVQGLSQELFYAKLRDLHEEMRKIKY